MKWIKISGPGQFRGEGKWLSIEEARCSEDDWAWNQETGYLPTAESDERPKEENK